MSQEDTARHRSHDGLYVLVLKMFCQFLTKFFRVFRMLKHIEFFYIQGAMQPRCKEKMAFQYGLRFNQ